MNNQPYDLKGHIKLATKTDAEWLQLDIDSKPLILKKGEEINVIISDSPWTIWKKIGDGQTRYKELDFANGVGIKPSINAQIVGHYNKYRSSTVSCILIQDEYIDEIIQDERINQINSFIGGCDSLLFEIKGFPEDETGTCNIKIYTIYDDSLSETSFALDSQRPTHNIVLTKEIHSIKCEYTYGAPATVTVYAYHIPTENSQDMVYAIGAGINDFNRRNAMEVYNDGRVELYRDAITEKEPVRYSQFIQAIGDVEKILEYINTGE